MSIERVKVRARVEVGDLSIETPFVQSFNVRKERGKVSTFDATLKVKGGSSPSSSIGDVKIYAGKDSASKLIFTGLCRSARISPCYDDPDYFILSISGADKLILLQGKKFTRRCRATEASWCAITGLVREGLRSGKLAYSNENVMRLSGGVLNSSENGVGTLPPFQANKNHADPSAGVPGKRNLRASVAIYNKGEEPQA